jgi:hypothetical protein
MVSKHKPIREIDDPIFLSYLSGLIDGEGCFSITKDKCGRKAFRIRVVLEEKDSGVLDFISKKIGGHRYHRKTQKSWKSHWHEQEEWHVSVKSDSLKLSIMIEPYLFVKKKVCNDFITEIKNYRPKTQ